ncbi:YciI family protein [Glaciimonas sp. Gout2]|uniref:YciI family protein n=1 Tax=unclassified Glaciimonas TaxID=2644401 RepID=UPI002AB43816|nr:MULTISPECIES: YciI family protein [unclassified Glaciimonas]MDY7548933.1 YciI family protein [Glaciimonas sp. CA11.2]MEB0013631.1 YciI family protein [Glaciimonas sp. Cout2]MEB0083657.1 YciI family protein [Glaciimonas sp. Gout2]
MIFCIYRIDRHGSGTERNRLRQPHLEYLSRYAASILLAGALLENGNHEDAPAATEIGSMYLVEFDVISDAEFFAYNDPFHLAGLFKEVSISAFEARIRKPFAGVN